MADVTSWHRVARLSELKEGEALGVRIGDVQIGLCRLGAHVHAFENVCPHAFALLSDGFVEGDEIECPLHAARFEIATGRCTAPPADRDLATYAVRIDGDDILVGLPE